LAKSSVRFECVLAPTSPKALDRPFTFILVVVIHVPCGRIVVTKRLQTRSC
jgi:hypothetical protein